MKENEEKYLMFGFDMETDVGSTSRDYNGVRSGTSEIIKILEKYGLGAAFFFTGDCTLKNREIVEMVNGKGYEIGCHSLYHEDLEEPSFSTSSFSPILEEELEHRLEINIDLIKKITNKDPVSFRSPRGFASNNLMKILENLNFQIDSSYIQSVHVERDFPYIGEHGFSALTFYLHPWEFYPMPKTIKYSEGTLYYDAFLYKNTGDVQIKEFDKFIGMCLEDGFKIFSLKEFKQIFIERK